MTVSSVGGASSYAAFYAQRSSATSASFPTEHVDIQANQDADLKYLTADDYKLASAVGGYDVKPDASGHVTSAPAILWQIAESRKAGKALDPSSDVTAAYINSMHNGNVDAQQRALEYILARDHDANSKTSSSSVSYLA